MSTPGVSQPAYAGTTSRISHMQVDVIAVHKPSQMATCRDQFGRTLKVNYSIMRAKGMTVETGERWIVDRQYGGWTFGAIMNGGTDGVIIPPESVTGLPEALEATDTRITDVAEASYTLTEQVRTDSLGQVISKGDILAATAPGVVTRRPAGTDGQVLVADSAQASGLAYRTPLALTAPLPGATAAGRYVGVTVSGAPQSGTYQTGDWTTTQSGFRYTCTAGGSPGTWRSTENEAVAAISRITALETQSQQLRDELYGGPGRTQNPYCHIRYVGSYAHAQVTYIFAQGGWTDFDQTDTNMRKVESPYTLCQIPVSGRYQFQFNFRGVSTIDGGPGVVVLKIARNSVNASSGSIGSASGWVPGYGNEVAVDCTAELVLNAGDKIYWGSYASAPVTMLGQHMGNVRTEFFARYLRGN